MNVLEGFSDWDKVIRPQTMGGGRKSYRLYVSKAVYVAMETNGFRGVFIVNERKISKGHSNATKLEEWKNNLPLEITLAPQFGKTDRTKFKDINVCLQGFTRDEQNNLVVKIDSPSFLEKR